MQFWTFLHIFSMFLAVTSAVGLETLLAWGVRRRDLGALRIYVGISRWAEPVGLLILVAGIIFGVLAALSGDLDLLQGWLVLAYILVGVGIVAGVASVPHTSKLLEAIRETEGDEPSEELSLLMGSPQPYVYLATSVLIFGAIVFVMVFKPAI